MDDSLQERGRAMEDLYFQQKDQQLLEKLKKELLQQESLQALERASGIKDAAVLERLSAIGISAESLAALGLIPLVAVAWADDHLDDGEKQAVLQAADISGIDKDSTAHQLLESWLAKKPDSDYLTAWEAYIGQLRGQLDSPTFEQLKLHIVTRAEDVAKAAGGFLGLGSKISGREQAMLDRLAKAFE